MNQAVKKVVIVGGGTAGWMAAAALSRTYSRAVLDITLVESAEIGTVGVGEASIPPIMTFNNLLGINEAEFMRNTQGTFKLGICFENWGRLGDSYIHPFSEYGLGRDSVLFHQYWMKAKQLGNPKPLASYSLAATAALEHKFTLLGENHPATGMLGYAYHFDASLYAKFLRNYAEALGVVRHEDKITKVHLSADGSIESVQLEAGTLLNADLFIDCSGFRGLLIQQALKVGYTDWSHYLPCNSAVAVPSENISSLAPYTVSTARDSGWQWRIPLQHRTGNGHVFSSDYMGEDEATAVLLANLKGPAIGEPRMLRFTTGHRNKFWHKNCVAMGLASGFIEPLESTSIHLIQTAIMRLITLFPAKGIIAREADEYNRRTLEEFEQIRDFIVLHYKATERSDTAFWRYCKEMQIPTSLQNKLDLFRHNGRIFRDNNELFAETSWVAVAIGQHILPQHYDPLVDNVDQEKINSTLERVEKTIAQSVASLPSHEEFVQSYCRAN